MSGTTRTTVVIDNDLLERAMELTGIGTKRAVIHEALQTLVRLHEQERVRAMREKPRGQKSLDETRERLKSEESVQPSRSPAQILAEERAKRGG